MNIDDLPSALLAYIADFIGDKDSFFNYTITSKKILTAVYKYGSPYIREILDKNVSDLKICMEIAKFLSFKYYYISAGKFYVSVETYKNLVWQIDYYLTSNTYYYKILQNNTLISCGHTCYCSGDIKGSYTSGKKIKPYFKKIIYDTHNFKYYIPFKPFSLEYNSSIMLYNFGNQKVDDNKSKLKALRKNGFKFYVIIRDIIYLPLISNNKIEYVSFYTTENYEIIPHDLGWHISDKSYKYIYSSMTTRTIINYRTINNEEAFKINAVLV